MREAPLTDRQRIVKLFVVWILGPAVLLGSPAVSLAGGFQALSPPPGLSFEKTQPVDFSWSPELYAVRYRLEVTDKNGQEVVSALLQQGTTGYRAPPWLSEKAPNGRLRWRVHAVSVKREEVRSTEWRKLTVKK